MLEAGRLGVYLTKEVHIHRVVDGNKVIQLRNDLNVIGVIHRRSHDIRILLDVVIELLCTGCKGIHLTAAVQPLVEAGDLARLRNIHKCVHIHLRMHAEILQIGFRNEGAHRIRHTADTQLQAGTVGNLVDDHLGDLPIHIGGSTGGTHAGHGGIIALHNHIHVTNVDLRAGQAVDPRHILIYFHNDGLCVLQHIAQMGSGYGKAEVAVSIHRRDLNHRNVRLCVSVTIEAGQFGITHGAKEAHPLRDDLPVNAAAMPRVPSKVVTGVIRLAYLGHPHGHAAVNLYVKQLVLTGSQRLIQRHRLITAPAIIHPVTGFDNLHRLIGSCQLLLIHFLYSHCHNLHILLHRFARYFIVKILSYHQTYCKQNVKKITIFHECSLPISILRFLYILGKHKKAAFPIWESRFS